MVRSIFALAAVLSVASASLASDLVTPVVFAGSNTAVTCNLLNVTSAPLPTEIQLVAGSGGTVLVNSGPVTVNPGGSTGFGRSGFPGPVYCRFVRTSKSKVRAVLALASLSSDGTYDTVVAAQ